MYNCDIVVAYRCCECITVMLLDSIVMNVYITVMVSLHNVVNLCITVM